MGPPFGQNCCHESRKCDARDMLELWRNEQFFATRWGIVIISPERAGKIPGEAFQQSVSASLQKRIITAV